MKTPRERKAKSADEALAALMRLCARAERSSSDALRLMRTWGVPETDRAEVLRKLTAGRFIDDARYAEAFVREKSRLGGWGAYKIRTALQRKGLDQQLIDTALAALDPAAAAERLRERLQRRNRTLRAVTSRDRKEKLLRYGLSLGYAFGSVRDAVEELTAGDEEETEWSDFF